jgi:hypothetical protein
MLLTKLRVSLHAAAGAHSIVGTGAGFFSSFPPPSPCTPISPPSGPATGSCNGLHR